MEDKSSNKDLIKMLKFVLFSLSAGLIQILSFTLLKEIIKFDYWPSYLISITLSVIWNFTFNRKFTFKDVSNVYLAMFKVIVFNLIFIPTSTILGNIIVENGVNEYIVLAVSMISNLILEYFYMAYIVFKNKGDEEDAWEG